jgi:hypothetical protein
MQNRLPSDAPFLLIIGFILSFMGLFTAYGGSIRPLFSVANDYLTPLCFYPNSFSMTVFLLGVVLVLYTTLWRIYDVKRDQSAPAGWFLTYCRQLSKYSLTIYILHFTLFFLPLRLIRLMTGKYYLREAMDTTSAFVLAIALLILCYPLLKLWDRADGRFSFEWLLSRLLSPGKKKAAA